MSPHPTNATIELHEEGFTLLPAGKTAIRVEWDKVREIVAERVDPTGEDMLTLGFRISNTDSYVTVHEHMPDYPALLEAMYEAYPKINREWWKELASDFGHYRQTIHGLPLSDPAGPAHRPGRHARFLRTVRDHATSRRRRRLALLKALGLLLLGGLQQFVAWLIASPPDGGWDEVLAVVALPLLLVVLAARRWPIPKIFFALLATYHVVAWGCQLVLHAGPTLLGQLFTGRGGYLLWLGLEILIGLGVMLLPDQRAAGRLPR
jgi:hypothetical protein